MNYSAPHNNKNKILLDNFIRGNDAILFGTGNLGKIALKSIPNTKRRTKRPGVRKLPTCIE